jgi:hypothetical protein
MNKKYFYILWFVSFFGFSQTEELQYLKGKVVCDIEDLKSISITNKRSQSIVNPEANGNFSMFVKIGDELLFDGMTIKTKQITLSEDDLKKKLFTITLSPKVIPLENVDIKIYKNINAVSLGILEKPAKKYTPAERKLRTAGEFHWYSPLLIPLGGMPLDGLLNSISGRTAMLKKELLIERNELAIQSVKNQFVEEYFVNSLFIPKENVEAFLFYVADNTDLRLALSEKNKIKTEFILSKLATEYLKLLEEKQ